MSLKKLYQAGFLSPKGGYLFLNALAKEGTNLMALLRFAKATAATQTAVFIDHQEYSYQKLYEDAQQLAAHLQHQKKWQAKEKLAIAAHNSYELIQLIFAASKSGLDLYLLNAEITKEQFQKLQKKIQFDHLVIDEGLDIELEQKTETLQKLLKFQAPNFKAKKKKSGLITVLTSGTSGHFKTATRKTATTPFIAPFLALLNHAHLDRYQSVFVATPIYHGFGLAAMIMAVALRATIYLQKGFRTKAAVQMIEQQKIEVLTAVPLIYDRLLQEGTASLSSLKAVLCGGAPLGQSLVLKSQESLGHILFNLYGTSEAGFCIMATPKNLAKESACIGKAIKGVKLKLANETGEKVQNSEIGHICIKSSWTIGGSQWVDTGDLAYEKNGLLFIAGRSDDMIVSGGENVYPIELEEVLLQHPKVDAAAALGVKDKEFGQRLVAFIQTQGKLEKPEIINWLKPKVARYQMPKALHFISQIPYNSLGKIDRKALLKILETDS